MIILPRWVWVICLVFCLVTVACGDNDPSTSSGQADDTDATDDDTDATDDDTGTTDDDTGTTDDDAVDDDTDDDDTTDDDVVDDDATDDDTIDDDTADDDTVEPVTLDLEEGCNHFSTSEECYLPYPSNFHQIEDPSSQTGVRVNYPDDVMPTGIMPQFSMDPTNTADGVSPAGPLLLHFGADMHPDHLTSVDELWESYFADHPIALFNYESGERVMFMSEMDENRKPRFPDRYAFIIRPMEPMEMGQRHIVVLTKNLTDAAGNFFASPEAFAVLRDRIPTTNPEIEDIRGHYEKLFAFLEEKGYPRENLLLAWDFMVASQDYLLSPVLSMRAETLQEVSGTGLGYTITRIDDNPNEYLARIVEGDFEVPHYLNADSEIDYDELHHPIRQDENGWYEYTMIIPKMALTQQEPLPLVVFGHGIFGNGRDYLNSWPGVMIHQWAEEAGAVVIATDWIGLSEGDLDLILNEVLLDLNRVTLVTDRLQQSLINNLVLTELTLGDLEEDPQIRIEGKDLIDDERVYYYGVSLGGIQGTSFVSISNRIQRGVLTVPGSVWLNMIPRSVVWVPIKVYMDIFYPDPLVQQLGIAFIQTRFDHSDPINMSKLMFKDPLPDAPPNRAVVLQEAIGDCQVPNMTTDMLARSIGLDLMTPSIYPVFGLDTLTSPTTQSALVQYELTDRTANYMPPTNNTPPLQDNGVHTYMCFMDHVLDQVLNFALNGELVQYCTGPCDPD